MLSSTTSGSFLLFPLIISVCNFTEMPNVGNYCLGPTKTITTAVTELCVICANLKTLGTVVEELLFAY